MIKLSSAPLPSDSALVWIATQLSPVIMVHLKKMHFPNFFSWSTWRRYYEIYATTSTFEYGISKPLCLLMIWTERTTTDRAPNTTNEIWRSVSKLIRLLEDLQLLKAHSISAFKRFWNFWLHPHLLPETLRVHLYNFYALPILLHNCGTWGLTYRDIGSLVAYHCRHVAAFSVSSTFNTLATRICTSIVRQNHFGSTWGGLDEGFLAIFFAARSLFQLSWRCSDTMNMSKYRGATPTCLPTILDRDLRLDTISTIGLRTTADLYALSGIAQDGFIWK